MSDDDDDNDEDASLVERLQKRMGGGQPTGALRVAVSSQPARILVNYQRQVTSILDHRSASKTL